MTEEIVVKRSPNLNQNVIPLEDITHAGTLIKLPASFSTPGINIVFDDFKYGIKNPSTGEYKPILKGISGCFKAHKLTCVMGSSGAGKTTLLSCVGGFVSGPEVIGNVYINGKKSTPKRVKALSSFVFQDDTLMETMTVKEAVVFSAKLRLPDTMTAEEKEERIETTLISLGLSHVRDSLIGSVLTRGVSGGERKRASIAVELVANPQILFLDEPTSGLDSYMALNVIKKLKVLSASGRTVVSTIHQPSSDLFFSFDELILLGKGRVIYHGPIDKVVDYFADRGYPCPKYSNPADFLFMHILNTEKDHQETTKSLPRTLQLRGELVDSLIDHWDKSEELGDLRRMYFKELSETPDVSDKNEVFHTGFVQQLRILSGRVIRNQIRNPVLFKAKLGSSCLLAIILGLLYLNIKNDQVSIQNRIGSQFFFAINNVFSSLMPTLSVFAVEKTVFQREYGTGLYGLLPYFISKILIELPINTIVPGVGATIMYWMIGYQASAPKFFRFFFAYVLESQCGAALGLAFGAMFEELPVALAAVPMIILPLILFSGYFVNSSTIPPYFDWLKWFSPVKYAFEIAARTEFEGLKLHCSKNQFVGTTEQICPYTTGEQVIHQYHIDYAPTHTLFGALIALYLGFLLMAFISLYRSAQAMKSGKKGGGLMSKLQMIKNKYFPAAQVSPSADPSLDFSDHSPV